ncbi:MAG TPA: RNA polymerase sigma factor [Baekduia sp.]|nr:RNA polymerase sigma factor [Baekduia sp.]
MPEPRDPRAAIDAVWRIESPRLIAGLARMVRDVGAAEDLAQDALVAALETWPKTGVPDNPGAWLMATGKRKAIDGFRRAKTFERKQDELAYMLGAELAVARDDVSAAVAEPVGDDLLRLMFTCCHPVLGTSARIALTLRMLGGLKTDEIARAYLTSEATIAQRIVRAKRTLAEAGVGFATPEADELPERLASVLEVVYLIFNEGYAATAGDEWLRPDLCLDALRLGRVLAELAPREPEVHGLVALMEIQASRIRARTAPDGTPILLLDQDRSLWDRLLITRGLAALARAEGCSAPGGPYVAQAAIAACHARARSADETNWIRIAALYEALARLAPSPVVEINRAVAISMAFGPAAALPITDALVAADALPGSHLLPSVHADLLARVGRTDEAHAELLRAAGLTRNARERELLLGRAAGL